MTQKEEKAKFQDEVGQMFRHTFMKEVVVTTKATQKIKQLMKFNTQDIIKDALKRAIRRDASLHSLQMPDLLYAIQRRGQKYKLKVGKTLVSGTGFGDFGENKYVINYDDQQQNDDQNEK